MDVIQMRHTRETAIKQWSATFKVSRPRAQGGDTAGRDVRATDLLACDHVCYHQSLGRAAQFREQVPTREVSEDIRGALLLFPRWLSAL